MVPPRLPGAVPYQRPRDAPSLRSCCRRGVNAHCLGGRQGRGQASRSVEGGVPLSVAPPSTPGLRVALGSWAHQRAPPFWVAGKARTPLCSTEGQVAGHGPRAAALPRASPRAALPAAPSALSTVCPWRRGAPETDGRPCPTSLWPRSKPPA